MTLPDGKTWRQPVEPAPEPVSKRGMVFLVILGTILIGSSVWSLWSTIYWREPPSRIATTLASQSGVLYYAPALKGDYHYTLETASGDAIPLSCAPVWTAYAFNGCLEPLAAAGLARWRPDRRTAVPPGPVVEVRYVTSLTDERFNNVVYLVRRGDEAYLDPDLRLAEAGIDPTGRSYSAARRKAFLQARRQRAVG